MDDSDTYGEQEIDDEEQSRPADGVRSRGRTRNVLDDGRADAPDRNDAVDSFGRSIEDDTEDGPSDRNDAEDSFGRSIEEDTDDRSPERS